MVSHLWVQGLFFISVVYNPVFTVESTLKLVTVIPRHGDRVPAPPLEFYPNDPYAKRNFDPPGYGKLTKSGELRELNLGKFLRKTYNEFFGPEYVHGAVEARSTDVNRTKESVKLILEGLYPGEVIPSTCESKVKDVLLFPQFCPGYVKDYFEAKLATMGELKKLEGFMAKLSKFTGKKIDSALDMYLLYTTLEAERFMNLTLPSWTHGIYPDGDLLTGSVLEFKIMNFDDKMRRRNGGRLIKKIKEDMESVENGSMNENRKLMLYGAHDLNVVAVLKALGVYYPHVPKFSSAVILELHLIHETYYVKVNYYMGVPAEMKTLQIPGCETLCPLNKFSDLMKNVIPTGIHLACDKVRGFLGFNIFSKNGGSTTEGFEHLIPD